MSGTSRVMALLPVTVTTVTSPSKGILGIYYADIYVFIFSQTTYAKLLTSAPL